MIRTGWMGDGPDAGPAMPVTERILAMKQRGPGDTLALAMARSRGAEAREARDADASAPDLDEYASGLVSRGYAPGAMVTLGQRLADKSAELAGELEKIEKGERVTARVRGMLERGQIGALGAAAAMDGDFGDAHRAEQLDRQCERLRREIAEAAEAITPPRPRQLDGVEAASRTANQVFRELTRAKMEAAQAGRSQPRPFAGAGLSAAAECSGPDCPVCTWGRAQEAERSGGDPNGYPAGAVITAEYDEVYR